MAMCRNHHDLLDMAVIESLPLRHAVWTAENFCPYSPEGLRIPGHFRESREPSAPAENGLPGIPRSSICLFLRS